MKVDQRFSGLKSITWDLFIETGGTTKHQAAGLISFVYPIMKTNRPTCATWLRPRKLRVLDLSSNKFSWRPTFFRKQLSHLERIHLEEFKHLGGFTGKKGRNVFFFPGQNNATLTSGKVEEGKFSVGFGRMAKW